MSAKCCAVLLFISRLCHFKGFQCFRFQFAGNKTSRGLCLKFDRKAFMCCLAGQNCHFQSQIVVSQSASLFFVQPNDPSMLFDHFKDAFILYSFCYQRIRPSLIAVKFEKIEATFGGQMVSPLSPLTSPGSSPESGRILRSFT